MFVTSATDSEKETPKEIMRGEVGRGIVSVFHAACCQRVGTMWQSPWVVLVRGVLPPLIRMFLVIKFALSKL
jgi:hypothetical protein